MYINHNLPFSGDYISALRGCCPLKFLHALETDQSLLAHKPKGDKGPPKKFNRKNLKSGLKFSVLGSISFSFIDQSTQLFFTQRERGGSW